MRFYPQDADSGGFFVTVLQKLAEFPKASRGPKNPDKDFTELPYRPIKAISPETLAELRETFGLGANFKSEQVFVRGEQKLNAVYYFESEFTTRLAREIPHNKLRTISGGVKVFTLKRFRKDQPEIPYPSPEAVHIIGRFMTQRQFYLKPEEIFALLSAEGDGVTYANLAPETANAIRAGPKTRLARYSRSRGQTLSAPASRPIQAFPCL
jgi:hypothetical protein